MIAVPARASARVGSAVIASMIPAGPRNKTTPSVSGNVVGLDVGDAVIRLRIIPERKWRNLNLNHLAHALLAGSDSDVLLGGMLGDFWRGAPDVSWRPGVRDGVVLHRKIDVYTDKHPIVDTARTLFDPPFRRFAGVLLDVYFDHVLARDWLRWSTQSLDALSERMLALLDANRDWLPPDLNRFAGYFRTVGLFASYADRNRIERVFAGIGQRFRHANPLAEAGPVLWERAAALDEAFERFFPDLQAFAAERRAAMGLI